MSDMENSKEKDLLLPMSIIIAAVMISGSVIYMVGRLSGTAPAAGTGGEQLAAVGGQNPAKDLKIEGRDVILGDAQAKVSLIEYGDYQCPFCGRFFSQAESQIRENYIKAGQVKMVYRNFAFLGPESFAAAEAAECAKDQGKFWAFHDALFTAEIADGEEHNGNLNRDLFLKVAGDLKLDAAAFAECYDGGRYKSKIEQDSEAAQAVGVNSTPTSFVNGEQVRGAVPYADFQEVIEKYLK